MEVLFIGLPIYWKYMRANFERIPWSVSYYQEKNISLDTISSELSNLEKRTWVTPNPSFVRSNFGLHGPGVILGLLEDNHIVSSLYFVGPSLFDKKVHIWTLVVDPKYRRRGFASTLLASASASVKGYARYFTYQTKTCSDALPLYLRLGSNIILDAHIHDTASDWSDPKIVIEVQVPINPLSVVSKISRESRKGEADVIKVEHNGEFWRRFGLREDENTKYELIDVDRDADSRMLYLRPATER